MSIYKDLKKAFISTIDVLADKTSTQAQKSRLVTVMKNEEKIANQAYVALGKYLYSTMREGMPEDVEQLCKVIDSSKERMTRAQEIYREVIRQEEVNGEINRTEVKENFRKVKEPIVAGAVNTAAKASVLVKDTAKDTVAKAETLKTAAAERAEDIKSKIHHEKEETAENAVETAAMPEAEREVIDVEVGSPNADTQVIESVVMEEAAPAEEPAAEPQAESVPVVGAAAEEAAPVEPAEKPAERRTTLNKARKLRDIITKKEEE